MHKTPETVDALFEADILKEDDIENAVQDDLDDDLLIHLEETTNISIFDSRFILEGEM